MPLRRCNSVHPPMHIRDDELDILKLLHLKPLRGPALLCSLCDALLSNAEGGRIQQESQVGCLLLQRELFYQAGARNRCESLLLCLNSPYLIHNINSSVPKPGEHVRLPQKNFQGLVTLPC
eukprot:1377068-Amorphochlora_amoeboformis.AAC.1